MNAVLVRSESTNEGTFGMISLASGQSWHTLELPWRDNQQGKSCVPEGTYAVTWRWSPKHGMCYHLEGVPGRSDVEMHSANFAGDVAQGYESQLAGCIALGKSTGLLETDSGSMQKAVLSSREAVAEFALAQGNADFQLTIKGS